MVFILITYKQFEHRKLVDKQELLNIQETDVENSITKMKTLNAQKRLTTTDYRAINLSELFKDNALTIASKLTKT